MLKRRTQDEAYPTDNAWNSCGWNDHWGGRSLRRTGAHPRNARDKQLARDPSLLLLLVVLWGQALLGLLRREEILPSLPLPLPLLAAVGRTTASRKSAKRRAFARRLRKLRWTARGAAHHSLPGSVDEARAAHEGSIGVGRRG